MADGYSAFGALTIFCLSLLFTPLAANVGLWFIRSPEPIVAPPGDETVFECSLNVPAEIVRWRHMGELMSMDHSPDSAVRRSSSAHLVVRVIDEKQAGDYQCVAWFGASALASIPAKLTLAELRPFLYQQPRHYGVSVGNIVAIDCPMPVSNPAPVIQYYHDDVRLPATVETVPSTSTLMLVNVTTKDSGVYTCSATNYITGQTVISPVKTHLTITNSNTPQPPRFLSTPQSLYVTQVGFNVSMECSGVGTPPPKVNWRKETGSLPNERIELGIGALKLSKVQRSDDGVYICELSSGSGPTASHRITLQVQESPTVKKEPPNSVEEEGSDVELECEAEGSPKPVLTWLLNGESVANDSHIHTSGGKLIIKQVQKRHAGIYQCFATNAVGVTYGSAMLQVSPKQVTAQGNGGDPADIEDPEFDDNPEGVSSIPPVTPGTRGHGKKEHSRNKTKSRRKEKKRKGNAVMIPPTKPNITRLSDKSVMVRWSVPANDGLPIQFFKVQYRELGSHSRGSKWMTSNEDIPPHIRSYEVDGLETDRTYRFRIAAVYSNNDNKLGQNSARFHLHKGPPSNRTPLNPPSLTETKAVSPNAIQIQWKYLKSISAPIDGFYVYYRATSSAGDYVKATVEGESTRSFNITHLQSDTGYDIKLQAFTVGAASDFSEILTHKTLKEPNATATPELDNNIVDSVGLGTTGSDSGSGQMYVMIGAALAGLFLLITLILLICLCNKNRSSGNNNEENGEDCDKTGVRSREPGLTIQQLEPVVNMNGFTHNGKTNGYVPHPINITSNPLAESQQDKNVMEMSYMTSQNNNRSSEGPSEDEIAGESSEKLTWRTREGRVGENYV